ncbi:NOT2 family protein [Aspergillus heteromorphus CBS 117.55]|uniref:NOT2 family protein n=1 Tax=Aspergillus heteromorphus CBS 117.55 TaxID=1448321 RepID=A0A317VK43_9EURO|nr:NOT2 family protein [Aspergillus heteromorphus CBS 117.55]PWY73621.1 NOT2 family protein [Aspergillus heteromorphus CBS 117.55]
MNRPGPGPQPLRGMSGFPAQQQAQARNAALASARLPNGKLGSGANWNFNLPVSGTPGIQAAQQRNIGTMGTFAQSLSGSQPATPLDLSDFPSLSGAPPQSQAQNPSHLVWANASQRAMQQTPSQPSHEDVFPSGAQFANRLDDFRNGGQGISGQLGAGGQPQTGNIEEFPPLGRNVSTDLGQDRRGSLMQSTGLGSYSGGLPFAGVSQTQPAQTRSIVAASVNGQERIMSPVTASSGGIETSRSPVNQGSNRVSGQEKEELNSGLISNAGAYSEPHLMRPPGFPATVKETGGATQSSDQLPLADMSELDKFGLAGLLRMIHSDNADVSSLAVGQDLMTLGLDLNQPEPLHTSFASPFVASMSGAPLEQDFNLPSCYSVANFQPLQSRIPSFSDETLFYIFYSMPRDILQEVVAEELMGRKWRYHKIERCWLTRDETYPGPVDVERGVSERGVYLLWDPASWKKIRREFILRYEDLDNRMDPNRGLARVGIPHHGS